VPLPRPCSFGGCPDSPPPGRSPLLSRQAVLEEGLLRALDALRAANLGSALQDDFKGPVQQWKGLKFAEHDSSTLAEL
jgi:hypothetical protein